MKIENIQKISIQNSEILMQWRILDMSIYSFFLQKHLKGAPFAAECIHGIRDSYIYIHIPKKFAYFVV